MGLSAINDCSSALLFSASGQPLCLCHQFKSGPTAASTATIQPMDITTKAATLIATARPVRLNQMAKASPKLVTAAEWTRKNAVGRMPARTRSTVVIGLSVWIIRAGIHGGYSRFSPTSSAASCLDSESWALSSASICCLGS
jgi:hypothetical protein